MFVRVKIQSSSFLINQSLSKHQEFIFNLSSLKMTETDVQNHDSTPPFHAKWTFLRHFPILYNSTNLFLIYGLVKLTQNHAKLILLVCIIKQNTNIILLISLWIKRTVSISRLRRILPHAHDTFCRRIPS